MTESTTQKPRCPVCGSPVKADWDRDCGAFYTCESCGHQFSFAAAPAETLAASEQWIDPDCPTLEEAETFLRAQGINPADLPNQFIEYLGKRHGELARLARNLCERLRAVHADSDYQGVWVSAQIHQGPYSGPTYTDELKALEDYLERKH